MPARIAVPLLSLALTTLLWLVLSGVAVVNYDTLYALLWGRQLIDGAPVDFTAAGAPTPHPLLTLAGAIGALIWGDNLGSAHSLSLIAWFGYFATCASAVLLGLVAKRSLGATAGVIAALLLLTREPVLSYGVRAYIDLAYLALVLAALALELGQRRRGTAVLLCLLFAGLLRPEAWLLSLAYLVWLWHGREDDPPLAPRTYAGLRPIWVVLAGAAPVVWGLTDLVLTGDLLFSFGGTRSGAERLDRPTGIDGLITVAPRRIGEILRWEVIVLAGAGFGLLWRRTVQQAPLLLGAGLVSTAAFALIALGGLPVIVRYLLPIAALLILLAALTLTGWRAERSIPFGRVWAVGAFAGAIGLLAMLPAQFGRIDRLTAALERQQFTVDELRVLVARAPCGPIAVPNRRAVPLVALWTGKSAHEIRTTQDEGAPARGSYLLPPTKAAADAFILDSRDRTRAIPQPAPGFRQLVRTDRWILAARCGPGADERPAG